MEKTAEHLEHIEHTQHAAHSTFDRKVAMTMAIVAAALAAVTMLSHKAHNDTILYQTQASDKWNEYQAKNIRSHEYEAFIELAACSVQPGTEAKVKEVQGRWQEKIKKYEGELPKMRTEAEELEKMSHAEHLKSSYFDLGELGIELALVFCSLAVLTKRSGFWFSGMGVGTVGIAVALCAYVLTSHH